jgi:DNA-binding beta-propeller fold protein YncE
MKVSRHFVLTAGREVGHRGPPAVSAATRPTAHAGGHGSEPPPTGSAACSPTWAQPSADGRRVFVACNGTSEIIDIDINIDIHNWKAPRRIPAGQGVYNLAVSRNGKLVATNRRDRSVSVFDVVSGRELDRVATKRRVVHGAAITADDRYAFISVEGVGAEPGTVEVLDLTSLKMVASVDVAPQAGGIDVVR